MQVYSRVVFYIYKNYSIIEIEVSKYLSEIKKNQIDPLYKGVERIYIWAYNICYLSYSDLI